MAQLTPQQRQYIRKKTKVEEPDPSEMSGELNIVPFLDITVNLVMFLLMLTTTIAFFAQVETRLPDYQRGGVGSRSKNPEKSLNLNLTITDRGVIVTGSGGKLEQGCESTTTGEVITVPNKGGEYDWKGLTTCVSRIQKEFPDASQVTISADPMVEFQYLVRAMDAVRSKGDQELFPDVLLSAGVR